MNRRDVFRFLPTALGARLSSSAKQTDNGFIRTGFKEFDELTGGLPPGSLTVLYGQGEAGKTTMAMNVAEHAAAEEKREVLYLVQNLSAQTLFSQMVCSRARVDFLDFAEGKCTADDETRRRRAERELASSSLTIDDAPHLNDNRG